MNTPLKIVCRILDLKDGYAILENKDKIWWLGGDTFLWPRSNDMKINDSVIITLEEVD